MDHMRVRGHILVLSRAESGYWDTVIGSGSRNERARGRQCWEDLAGLVLPYVDEIDYPFTPPQSPTLRVYVVPVAYAMDELARQEKSFGTLRDYIEMSRSTLELLCIPIPVPSAHLIGKAPTAPV